MKILVIIAGFMFQGFAQAASIPTNLEFSLKNGANGETVYRMADHRNSVFVFEIFNLSCGACNENVPYVEQLASDYKDNPRVQVIDMGLDSSEAFYREWLRRHAPNHPVVADPTQRVYNALRTEASTPQAFIVNCEGVRAGGHVGAWVIGEGEQAIRSAIEKALKTTCP